MPKSLFCLRVFLAAIILCVVAVAETETKPRLLVLTDIGGDPDDQQSLVRLLHYANEFEIEGLIASAAGTPGELKERVTRPELIRQKVEAYAQVRSNLLRHAAGFPPAEQLLGVIKAGNSERGLTAVGENHDTEGSNWIIAAADRVDQRPLNITIWGGQTDLAQALWRIRKERGEWGLKEFAGRTRIFDIDDQDGIAEWLWKEFPGLFYVLSKAPKGVDKREGAYRGMYLGGDETLVSRDWMERNIRQDHGPLGALYPPRTWTAPSPHSAIKEGDTPSWFYFLRTGVNDPNQPEWGGWGGRYTNAFDRVFRDARDTVGPVTDARATVWRWRPAFQADFQARLDWAVADSFAAANHAPKLAINGQAGPGVMRVSARRGQTIKLRADVSDPDRDETTMHWAIYREAGTFAQALELGRDSGLETALELPEFASGGSVHVICEAVDHGRPNLRTARRVIIEVSP